MAPVILTSPWVDDSKKIFANGEIARRYGAEQVRCHPYYLRAVQAGNLPGHFAQERIKRTFVADFRISTLAQAAKIKGSTAAVADHLGVPLGTLSLWLAGEIPVPPEAYFKAIVVIVSEKNDAVKQPGKSAGQASGRRA